MNPEPTQMMALALALIAIAAIVINHMIRPK